MDLLMVEIPSHIFLYITCSSELPLLQYLGYHGDTSVHTVDPLYTATCQESLFLNLGIFYSLDPHLEVGLDLRCRPVLDHDEFLSA